MKTLLGTKVGMTQIFTEDGKNLPVTVVQVGPCVVTQLKTEDKDGYTAVQLGFGDSKRLNKAELGQRRAAGAASRQLREVRLSAEEIENVKVGDTFDVTLFTEGDKVAVAGTSKGKGFAGTIKRHNFKRGPKSHGSHNVRQPGSIGSMFPQHVMKGMKMAGRMGHARRTVKNLEVVGVDAQNNLLLIKGALPGSRKSMVIVEGVEA